VIKQCFVEYVTSEPPGYQVDLRFALKAAIMDDPQ